MKAVQPVSRPVVLHWPGRPQSSLAPRDPGVVPLMRVAASRPHVGSARLVRGDAVQVADRLLHEGLAGRVDVIHLDPPFGSDADYARLRDVQTADGAVPLRLPAYTDTEELATWLDRLEPVLHRCHALLSPRGSLYLHLDFRRAPYARILLDTLFGADHLCNEIVWAYGLGGSSDRRFQRKHDVIAFYAKDLRHHWFQAPREAATSQRMRGQAKLATDVWVTDGRDDADRIQRDWADTLVEKTLSNSDSERTGYPTQKPMALATRIIQSSLPPGGLALDLMCGSGTFGVAAVLAGGSVVLGDRGDVAMDVTRSRLVHAGGEVRCEALASAPIAAAPIAVAVRIEAESVHLDELDLSFPSDSMMLKAHDALGAWGICDDTAEGLLALAWWDGAAQRHRSAVPRSLALATRPARPVWLGVDLAGRWLRCDIG